LFDYGVLVLVFFCTKYLVLLVSSVLSQGIGWVECLQNDLFCIELDVKLYSVWHHRNNFFEVLELFVFSCVVLCSCTISWTV